MPMNPQKMAAILQRVQLARQGGAGGPPTTVSPEAQGQFRAAKQQYRAAPGMAGAPLPMMPMQGTPPMGGPPKMPGGTPPILNKIPPLGGPPKMPVITPSPIMPGGMPPRPRLGGIPPR